MDNITQDLVMFKELYYYIILNIYDIHKTNNRVLKKSLYRYIIKT